MSALIGWEAWCHSVDYPIKSPSATQTADEPRADSLRTRKRAQQHILQTLSNPLEIFTSHHVQRTWLAAQHLPGEVRATRVFCHFPLLEVKLFFLRVVVFFITFSPLLFLQGKGAESFVWQFATEVWSQYHWAIKEKVRHTFKVSVWASFFHLSELNNTFLQLFLMILFFCCRINVNEPLKWKESFEKLLSSQSKYNPPHHSWFFSQSRWFQLPARCLPICSSSCLDGLCVFRAFLISEFSEENIAFYLACEDYRTTKPSKLGAKAKKIYDEFIGSDAPREVNIK